MAQSKQTVDFCQFGFWGETNKAGQTICLSFTMKNVSSIKGGISYSTSEKRIKGQHFWGYLPKLFLNRWCCWWTWTVAFRWSQYWFWHYFWTMQVNLYTSRVNARSTTGYRSTTGRPAATIRRIRHGGASKNDILQEDLTFSIEFEKPRVRKWIEEICFVGNKHLKGQFWLWHTNYNYNYQLPIIADYNI